MAYFVLLGVLNKCGTKIEVKVLKTPKLKVLRVKRFCFLKKNLRNFLFGSANFGET